MTPPYKMPFGKFKGRPLNNIPAEYLIWLHTCDIDDALKGEIEYTLRTWHAQRKDTPSAPVGKPKDASRRQAKPCRKGGKR